MTVWVVLATDPLRFAVRVIAVVATQEQAEALASSGSPRWQWSIVQRQVGGAAGAGS